MKPGFEHLRKVVKYWIGSFGTSVTAFKLVYFVINVLAIAGVFVLRSFERKMREKSMEAREKLRSCVNSKGPTKFNKEDFNRPRRSFEFLPVAKA